MGGYRYMREFGFVIPERPVVVDDVRVRGTGRSGLRLEDTPKAKNGPPRVDKVGGITVLVLLHPQDLGTSADGRPGHVEGPQGRWSRSPAHSTPICR